MNIQSSGLQQKLCASFSKQKWVEIHKTPVNALLIKNRNLWLVKCRFVSPDQTSVTRHWVFLPTVICDYDEKWWEVVSAVRPSQTATPTGRSVLGDAWQQGCIEPTVNSPNLIPLSQITGFVFLTRWKAGNAAWSGLSSLGIDWHLIVCKDERETVVSLSFLWLCCSGFAVGIYTTNSPEACQYVADNSKANIIVVENHKQLQKILQVRVKWNELCIKNLWIKDMNSIHSQRCDQDKKTLNRFCISSIQEGENIFLLVAPV